MKNIKRISFERLTNKDFHGFHLEVAKIAASISLKDVRARLETYNDLIRRFSDYTTSSSESLALREVSRLSDERLRAFFLFRNYAKVLKDSTDDVEASLGLSIWNEVKGFGKISVICRNQVTSVVTSVVQNVGKIVGREAFAETYASSELERRFERLKKAQQAFSAANLSLFDERKIRKEDSTPRIRKECEDAFRMLVNYALYNASEKGDGNCDAFIDKVTRSSPVVLPCTGPALAVGNAWRRMRKSVLSPMPPRFKAR